jgi:hypothetical protein
VIGTIGLSCHAEPLPFSQKAESVHNRRGREADRIHQLGRPEPRVGSRCVTDEWPDGAAVPIALDRRPFARHSDGAVDRSRGPTSGHGDVEIGPQMDGYRAALRRAQRQRRQEPMVLTPEGRLRARVRRET